MISHHSAAPYIEFVIDAGTDRQGRAKGSPGAVSSEAL
jgi:hypothetical protein